MEEYPFVAISVWRETPPISQRGCCGPRITRGRRIDPLMRLGGRRVRFRGRIHPLRRSLIITATTIGIWIVGFHADKLCHWATPLPGMFRLRFFSALNRP